MVDDRPDDASEPGRAKRPPPTLELSATEVPRDDDVSESAPMADEKPPQRPASMAPAAISGALAGAFVAALAWFAASTWLTATPDPQSVLPPQANAMALDALSSRLAKLEGRPAATTSAAPPDLSAITARLDALDKSAAGLRDETTALRAQSSQALTAATDAQKDAKAAPRPATPDLSGITNRLSQIEAATRAQDGKIAEQARKPVDELTTRRIATASLLDAQVRAGEPYGVALTAAKALVPDAKLNALDVFATTGVPSANALARALLELPDIAPPASTATSSGLIDRLKSGATKLVKIERTDAVSADNAALTRAADAARRDDVAMAVRELGALPPSERTAFQAWLDRVSARDAARAASRQFANDALAAMSKIESRATQ